MILTMDRMDNLRVNDGCDRVEGDQDGKSWKEAGHRNLTLVSNRTRWRQIRCYRPRLRTIPARRMAGNLEQTFGHRPEPC